MKHYNAMNLVNPIARSLSDVDRILGKGSPLESMFAPMFDSVTSDTDRHYDKQDAEIEQDAWVDAEVIMLIRSGNIAGETQAALEELMWSEGEQNELEKLLKAQDECAIGELFNRLFHAQCVKTKTDEYEALQSTGEI